VYDFSYKPVAAEDIRAAKPTRRLGISDVPGVSDSRLIRGMAGIAAC
jgi:hypothetical protein